MKTNRRRFIGSAGLGFAGIFLDSKLVKADSENIVSTMIPQLGGVNPRDVKINVKVIFYAMIHSGIWEGPCRYTGGGVGPEQEKIQAKIQFDEYVKNFKSNLSQDVKMLEPVYFEFNEFVKLGQEDLLKLEADKEEVDLYVITGMNLSSHIELYFVSVLSDIYKKPIVGNAMGGRATTSYLRSKGLEGYAAGYYGGLNKLFSLLRARKAFQQTNMLLITDFGGVTEGPGYLRGSIRDFDDLKNRFGIGTTIIRFKELSDERDRIMKSGNSMAEVENLTDKLIKNAQGVHIDRKMFTGDLLFYYTVKNLLKKYNSNAFCVESFEFCASRLPDKWKIVPCLTHSLLKDEGYPSACEGDVCALLTEALFMAISKESAYMGNMTATRKGAGRSTVSEGFVSGAEIEGDKLLVGHNVPGLKMLGFDKPDLPYEIRNFINAKPDVPGWGGTLKIDFTKIEEKTVTIGRFNPLTTKMLVTKGEVIGSRGFDSTGCSLGAIINVKDPVGFEAKSSDYGFHFAMAYGDYTQELVHLADMLKIELELHNLS